MGKWQQTSPGVVEPVARIAERLVLFLGGSLVGKTGLLQQYITRAWLGNCCLLETFSNVHSLTASLTRDAVEIAEFLELAGTPSVQDPILDVEICRLGLVLGFVPGFLDTADQSVTSFFVGDLDFQTLELEIVCKLVAVPVMERLKDVVSPVLLDKILELLTIRGSRVGDIVVIQPLFQLVLVPLVVGWRDMLGMIWKSRRRQAYQLSKSSCCWQ